MEEKQHRLIRLISKKIDSNQVDMFNLYSKVVHQVITQSIVPYSWSYDRIFLGCATPKEIKRYSALKTGTEKLIRKLRELLYSTK